MKTNTEMYEKLRALAVALASSANRLSDLPDTLASLDAMRLDRDKLMTLWITMHYDHVLIHGDCSNIC